MLSMRAVKGYNHSFYNNIWHRVTGYDNISAIYWITYRITEILTIMVNCTLNF